ncbi:MAG: hypothetical protein ACRCV5_10360 [Afipia sp.]
MMAPAQPNATLAAAMSIRVMQAVWDAGDACPVAGSDLVVLLRLADLADDAGEVIHRQASASLIELARAARIHPRQAQRIIRRLVDAGWVEVVEDARRGRARRYRIRLDRLPAAGEWDDTHVVPSDTAAAAMGRHPGHDGMTPASQWDDAGVIPIPLPSTTTPSPRAREDTDTASSDDRPRRRRSMPADYAPSPAVRAWAAAHGYDQVDEHLDHLRDVAAARGYRYVDWDAVLRRAIRQDWAGLRTPRPGASAHGSRPISAAEQVEMAVSRRRGRIINGR